MCCFCVAGGFPGHKQAGVDGHHSQLSAHRHPVSARSAPQVRAHKPP